MRKALVPFIGVVLGVFPASAAASQFAFEGNNRANGDAPVEMTLTGKSLKRPLHVTSFSIGMDLVVEDCPGYSGKDPLPLPIHRGSGGRHGIRIRPRSSGQLYFEWHYKAPGGPYEQLQGAQLGPRRWIGEFSINWLPGHPPGGTYQCYSNYEPQWQAKFVPSHGRGWFRTSALSRGKRAAARHR
jgi:hypothetical protein